MCTCVFREETFMKTYTVRFADKLKIIENNDETFGIQTSWLKLNLYKGSEHISHHFDKKKLCTLLCNFNEKGGFVKTVGYSMGDICSDLDTLKIKIDRKFIWALQHVFKKPRVNFGDSNKIAICKQRMKSSKDNLVIVYSITFSKVSYPKEHLVARLVGFNITSSNAPSISFYNYNMQPMTISKRHLNAAGAISVKSNLEVVSENNKTKTLDEPPLTSHNHNTQLYYNKIINLLDSENKVYYNGIVVRDIVLANHRNTGNSIFIVNEYGDFEKKVTDYTRFTTLSPITI